MLNSKSSALVQADTEGVQCNPVQKLKNVREATLSTCEEWSLALSSDTVLRYIPLCQNDLQYSGVSWGMDMSRCQGLTSESSGQGLRALAFFSYGKTNLGDR